MIWHKRLESTRCAPNSCKSSQNDDSGGKWCIRVRSLCFRKRGAFFIHLSGVKLAHTPESSFLVATSADCPCRVAIDWLHEWIKIESLTWEPRSKLGAFCADSFSLSWKYYNITFIYEIAVQIYHFPRCIRFIKFCSKYKIPLICRLHGFWPEHARIIWWCLFPCV